jgi:filamentous hemagglutinin family protein
MSLTHAFPRTIRRHAVATAVACCFAPALAWANPVGPVVTHGQATFNTQGKVLTVTNTPGSIINWQGFSIGAGETTKFIQQSAASAVLNRVVSGEASSILGRLQSNGRVFLVNPNGIVFGAGAYIDTAGLVASTLNIMDADFLTGKLRFGGTPDAKAIANAGEIVTPAGGRVMLIASEGVTNTGIINTPQGEVILAAGKTVELTDTANPEVRFEVSAPQAQSVNLGKIVADAGRIGLYGSIVSNRGTVSANTAMVGENGKIVFRAVKETTLDAGSVTTANGPSGGSIEVSSNGTTLVAGDVQAAGTSGKGGEVKLLGDRVGLVGAARIDVSGDQGGGTALVGGDLQGANAAVRNAQFTYIGADAQINADAITTGDGGKIIAWADDTTRSHGSISARGGRTAGNGGFVETSGKLGLEVTKGPDVRAPAGTPGTWLIDPVDLTVVPGGFFDTTLNSGAPFFAPLTEGSTLGVDLINAQLDFGSNVILNTTSRGATPGTDQGNITIAAPIVKSASTQVGGPFIGTTSLTLQAHNNIVITPAGSITTTGDPLSVNLAANIDNSGGGGITIDGPITTRGASFTANATDAITVSAPINTMNALGSFGGNVQMTASTGAITSAGAINGGFIGINGAGGVTISGAINSKSSISIGSNNGTTTLGANVTTSSGSIGLSGRTGIKITGGAQVSGTSNFSASTSDTSASIDIDAGSSVTGQGAYLSADNMEIQGTVTAGNGGIQIEANSSGRTMNLGTNTAGQLALTQTELNNLSTTNYLYLYNYGPTTVSAPINFNPTYVYLYSAGALTTTAGLTAPGMLYIDGGTTVSLAGTLTAPTFNLYAGGAVTQNAGANIAVSGNLSMSGSALTLNGNTSGGDVTLSADAMTISGTVSSAANIGVNTRNFVPVNLGVATKSGGSLELTAAELNRFTTAAGTGVLQIGSTGNGQLTIQGPIAPTGTQNLVLSSDSGISQAPMASITVPKLGIMTYGNVLLTEGNAVGTLTAQLYSNSSTFDFTNAPGQALTVGGIPNAFIDGIQTFGSTASIALNADAMTISSPVSANLGSVTIRPTSAAVKVDLGGADVANTTLGLDANDVANVFGGKLNIKTDRVDISAPVQPGTNALGIAPLTLAGGNPRAVTVVATKTGGADLELTNADINNVTVGELALGDAVSGPLTVQSAVTVPSTIGTLSLNSGDQVSGVTINAPMSSTSSFALVGDVMFLNAPVSTSAGSILIAPNTAGRGIELGSRTAGTLGLSASEIETMLSAPLGTLTFGSMAAGNIDVLATLNLASSNPPLFRDVSLVSGGTIYVDADASITAPGSIMLNANRITLSGPLTSVDVGSIALTADRMDIHSHVEAQNLSAVTGQGEIRIQSRTPRLITLGSDDTLVGGTNLGLTPAEMGNLEAQSVLRIGDAINTRSIQIDPVVNDVIQPSSSTMSLVAGPTNISNSITQTGAGTISVSSLAATARNGITLDQSNDIDTIAATVTGTGNINVTYSGSNPFTVGLVDGISGLRTNNGTIRVRSDELNIIEPIVAGFGSSNVTLQPLTANQSVTLGSKPGGTLGLDASDLNRIAASTLTIGDTTNTADISLTNNVALTGGPDGIVNNLALTTQSTRTTSLAADLSVQGSLTINTGILNVGGTVTSQFGSISGTADAMNIAAPVSATFGNITLQPRTNGLQIALGGADVNGTVLGLDSTDLGNLVYGNTLLVGNNSAGNIDVTYAGSPLANNVALSTGGTATFNSASFEVDGLLNITANSMSIPGGSLVKGSAGVSITPATVGRNVVLGTKPGGAALELDTAELGRLAADAGRTLTIDTTGTLTTTAPLTFTTFDHLQLGAGTLTHTGGTLTVPNDIILRANTMTVSNTVVSGNGGRILVAPRTSSFRAMNLGTNPAGSALGLTPTEIGQFSTTGVVQFGDTSSTGSISITQPFTQPVGSSALVLASNGGISQSAGATVSANNLRLATFSSVTLNESNSVNTLAGSSSGSFSFSNGVPLTIGTVDGFAGISDSNIILRANALDIAAPIIGNAVTLAPLTGGTTISLGTETAGQLSLTDAEIDQINASNVVIGTSAAPNATGAINVNATVDRSFGHLTLVTGAGNTINVNAPIGSASTSTVQLNAGAGGTTNVNGPVIASGNVTVTADAISTTQQITSNFGSVTLQNSGTNGSVTLGGVVDANNSVQVTGKTITVNAPATARASFSSINLAAPFGSTGSSVTINNQLTAGSSISITTDSIAINAPLVTLNSTISLQPRTAGTPISLGTETSGAFSLTTTELALLQVENLSIGNSNSGPLSINAPITSSTIQQLNLTSGGDITQSLSAPITLSYAETDFESGYVQPLAGLNVVSTGGKVELPADNNINNSVTGQAGGSTQNFVFKNTSPLKLQNVSTEIGFAPTGKTLFNAPPGNLAPVTGNSIAQDQAIDAALAATLEVQDTQKNADDKADADKEDSEKKDREERKKEGKKSCS